MLEEQSKRKESRSSSPLKEQRAAIEASRLEIREKVKIKLKQVIEFEEFKALKKNNLPKEPEETAEEKFLRELATLEKLQ